MHSMAATAPAIAPSRQGRAGSAFWRGRGNTASRGLRGESGAFGLVLVREVHVRGGRKLLDSTAPGLQRRRAIVKSTQAHVSPVGGGDQLGPQLIRVRRAERHIPLAQSLVAIGIEPGGVSEFECRLASLAQQRDKPPPPRQSVL